MIILCSLLAILVLFLIVVALQAPQFRVTRAAAISAPASIVFDQVNDFRNWNEWSPWAKLDPTVKITLEGPPAGPGAKYSWTSDSKKVGQGRMTLTDNRPSEMVRITLEFLRPFQATNTVEFTFQPQGDQTAVTWNMTGRKNFFAKAFHLFVNCDKLIGGDFEKGLAKIKSISEAASAR